MLIINTFILNETEWRETKYKGYYVTKFGEVAKISFVNDSLKSFFLMKQEVVRDGYRRIEIGKGSHKLVHRLVYETWKEPLVDGFVIDHIDANPSNNNIENLRQVTQKENILSAMHHGNFGQNGNHQVIVFNKETNEEKRYESIKDFLIDIKAPKYMIEHNGLSCLKKRREYNKYIVTKISNQ